MRPEGGPSSMLAGVLVKEGLDPERHTRGLTHRGKACGDTALLLSTDLPLAHVSGVRLISPKNQLIRPQPIF